ncbi:KilA-N domain-containing protein [Cronobacter malonaticus]|uniref:KilA-N domain-containing protein n=1 Tax=Cronobacter malonaticus TaxID=413503 RepID=UPI001F3F238F|nr:KilA-N domain-containing protein [Cronobacter malonaticus]
MAATIEASNLPVNHEVTDMKSLAKSTVNCTNSIIISDIKIHTDAEGRYSLNDLHKAAGKEHRHLPNYWMDLQQTKELIEELVNTGNPVFKPTSSKKGRYGGTYVCKELVYSYAMWISAAFALKVIRAYDALVTGNANEAVRIAKTTVSERTPLRDAVNMLVGKKGLRYDDAYNMVHQRFNIDSIDELEIDQIPLAVEYIHRVVLEGEYLGKQEVLPVQKLEINFPISWWNQFDYIMKARGVGEFSHSSPCHFPVKMLFGDPADSPSAISKLLYALERAGYDVSACRLEHVAQRHYAEIMHSKLQRMHDICEPVLNSTTSFRISPSMY